MFQDNQENEVVIYQKLGKIVFEILSGSNNLLSSIKDIYELYKPKSLEEAPKLNSFCFDLPDSIELLCDIRGINIPDDYEFYNSVASLREMAIDVAVRMVNANVIVSDVINENVEPQDVELQTHLYLSVLKPISNNICYMREKLEKLYKETSLQCPDLLMQGKIAEEAESVLPGEDYYFQLMKRILVKTLKEYAKDHESERISNFVLAIQNYLEDFEKGIEPNQEFDFGFAVETEIGDCNDMEYMDFHFQSEMINVSSGGSVYDKAVGGDSYTNWDYYIMLNGCSEENDESQYYRFSTVLELVRSGAELYIENPEEFMDNKKDELE